MFAQFLVRASDEDQANRPTARRLPTSFSSFSTLPLNLPLFISSTWRTTGVYYIIARELSVVRPLDVLHICVWASASQDRPEQASSTRVNRKRAGGKNRFQRILMLEKFAGCFSVCWKFNYGTRRVARRHPSVVCWVLVGCSDVVSVGGRYTIATHSELFIGVLGRQQ